MRMGDVTSNRVKAGKNTQQPTLNIQCPMEERKNRTRRKEPEMAKPKSEIRNPKLKVVYIAGPYRARTDNKVEDNIQTARARAIEVWKLGAVAVPPQLMTAHMGGVVPEEQFLDGLMELLRRADCVMTCGEWQNSFGARQEYKEALRLGKPVFHELVALEAWLKGRQLDDFRRSQKLQVSIRQIPRQDA